MAEYYGKQNKSSPNICICSRSLKLIVSVIILLTFIFVLKCTKGNSFYHNRIIQQFEEANVRGEESEEAQEILDQELQEVNEYSTKTIRDIIKCSDKDFRSEIIQHGEYWLLKNYVKASSYFKCDDSITYTTHSDFTFLENVVPLLERWQAPLSMALWAPGDFFEQTLKTVAYLRKCHEKSALVVQFATFHIFFESRFMPTNIPHEFSQFEENFDCQEIDRFASFSLENSVKAKNNLTYPINIGRNLAREAALTHFVLPSDVELFPSSGLVIDFLNMELPDEFQPENNVFVLPVFEVELNQSVPEDKTALINMFNAGTAIWFHFKVCPECHKVPKAAEWIRPAAEASGGIFTTAKRQGDFFKWEPIFIGTNAEPLYDERLSWDGKKDKMTQSYTMCLLDYNFHILSNGFLVHKPGIKTKKETIRPAQEKINEILIQTKILPEITILYGKRDGCKVH